MEKSTNGPTPLTDEDAFLDALVDYAASRIKRWTGVDVDCVTLHAWLSRRPDRRMYIESIWAREHRHLH